MKCNLKAITFSQIRTKVQHHSNNRDHSIISNSVIYTRSQQQARCSLIVLKVPLNKSITSIIHCCKNAHCKKIHHILLYVTWCAEN